MKEFCDFALHAERGIEELLAIVAVVDEIDVCALDASMHKK